MGTKKTCGDCVNMRAEDGYCGRKSAYVHVFDEAPGKCFVSKEDVEETIAAAPKIPRRKRGKPTTTEIPKAGQKPKRDGRRGHYLVPEGMKYCPTCGKVKPLEDFGNCKSKSDGKAYQCKECAAATTRENYRKKKEEIRRLKEEGAAPQPAKAEPKESTLTIKELSDADLVAELRYRGWTVTCRKSI